MADANDLDRSVVRMTVVATDGPGHSPQLLNLSTQSLVVRSAELLEPGRPVRLTLELYGQTVEIDAVVVWSNQKQGDMALRFVSVSKGGHEMLSRHLTA